MNINTFSSLPLLNISPSFPVVVIIKEIDNMPLEEGRGPKGQYLFLSITAKLLPINNEMLLEVRKRINL